MDLLGNMHAPSGILAAGSPEHAHSGYDPIVTAEEELDYVGDAALFGEGTVDAASFAMRIDRARR